MTVSGRPAVDTARTWPHTLHGSPPSYCKARQSVHQDECNVCVCRGWGRALEQVWTASPNKLAAIKTEKAPLARGGGDLATCATLRPLSEVLTSW
jgi:hypothetical protein